MDDFWSKQLTVSDNVLHQELGGETVLLNLDTEHYFGLDEVGTRIWQLLAERLAPGVIVGRLLDEYEAQEEQVRADVQRLVGELVAAGLILTEG